MEVTVIHGSPRKGNTYEIAQKFMREMQTQGEVSFREFFLPQDMPEFCRGCFTCILRDEKLCPHGLAHCSKPHWNTNHCRNCDAD